MLMFPLLYNESFDVAYETPADYPFMSQTNMIHRGI